MKGVTKKTYLVKLLSKVCRKPKKEEQQSLTSEQLDLFEKAMANPFDMEAIEKFCGALKDRNLEERKRAQ